MKNKSPWLISKIKYFSFYGISCFFSLSAQADTTAKVSPDVASLQQQVDLEKQKNAIQADLLASQKSLIDAQKASVDSQTQLATAQKSLLDGLFPQITGGKAGSINFDSTTNIGPIAQPDAIAALNKSASDLCAKVDSVLGNSTVILTDNDLKLVAQARSISMQLASLEASYKSVNLKSTATLGTTNALPPGLALYGVGAALKEVASFTQLFRKDTTFYGATIIVDQDTLNHAIASCVTKEKRHVYTPKTLLVASLSQPDLSNIQTKLKNLAGYRIDSDAELNDSKGKSDAVSQSRVSKLTALNSTMDSLVSSLFATSDKAPEPMFIGVIAGEAIFQKIGAGARVLRTTLVSAAAAGVKRSSIWFSDRLYSWSTITTEYVVFDNSGEVFSAGTINNSPQARKIEITR